MKIDVAKQIVDLLIENGSVRVPELGLFLFDRKAATFEPGKLKMNPPAIDIIFKEDEGESEALADRIKKNYKVSKSEAREVVLQFSDKALNALMKLGKVRITGLGMLTKDKDDAVVFSANKGFTQQFFAGLPIVDTQIEDRKTVVEESPEVVEKPAPIPPIETKEVKSNEAIITPEIKKTEPVKDPFAISYDDDTIIPEIKPEAAKHSTAITSPSTASEPKSLNETISERQNIEARKTEPVKTEPVKTEPIKNEPEPVYYGDDDGYGKGWFVWPTIFLLLFCLATIFGLKKCSKSDNTAIASTEITNEETVSEDDKMIEQISSTENDTETVAVENGTGVVVDEVNNAGQDQTTDKANGNTAEDLEITEDISLARDKNECIIVTGVFKAKRNADRMIRHIKTSGYIPYAQQHEDNIRVGLQFNCADADLVDFIRVIRRNISQNAWYLQPKLEVK